MKTILVVGLFLFCYTIGCCCVAQPQQSDTVFQGRLIIGFGLGQTYLIEIEEREKLEKRVDQFQHRMKLLLSYFKLNKSGKASSDSAEKILQSDSLLSSVHSIELATYYYVARMKEMGLLFKPCFRLDTELNTSNLIFCSEEQLQKLEADEDAVYKVECEFLGEILYENSKMYRLKKYERVQ